jgi:hypothetical protein
MATKTEIFKEYVQKYLKANKEEKGNILTHVCFVTRMHRKAAIRKFRRLQMHDSGIAECRGRNTLYTADVTVALKDVWEAGNEVCGELLHPMIREYVDILRRDGMWEHAAEVTEKLLCMSESTVRRRVGKFQKAKRVRKGISATRPSHLKQIVPIFTGPWTDKPPGWGQIDTVLHSDSATGNAVYTLNYTDAATLLVIPRAQWNKGQEATRESMRRIKERMPFPWLGAHPDTGSEFINRFVLEWCQTERIDFSRSRPNRKNDNMYVEERNGHVIRRTVGYLRLDCPEAMDALNLLYDVLTPYLMHFVAVRRTTGKEKILSRYRRTYEKQPKTPYQRILDHKAVAEEIKERLRKAHAALNPLVLKKDIDRRLKILYDTQRRCGGSGRDI